MTAELEALAGVIRRRRTHMLVDREQQVSPALLERLCNLATWAPNHKSTSPWRFAAFTGDGRGRLGEAFVADMIEAAFGDDAKRTKTLTKYLRTPAVLVAASATHPQPMLDAENRYAVAAGIQNLLLAATAAGLASFWSTPPVPDGKHVIELCGFEPGVTVIGVIYLGWPTKDVAAPERAPAQLTIVDE